MSLNRKDIEDALSYAISMGIAISNKAHEPSSDLLSLNKACKFLRKMGYIRCMKMLRLMIDDGRLKIVKKGRGDKPIQYVSYLELQKILFVERFSK